MTSHRTPPDAATLMAQVLANGLDAPILDPSDMRWDCLRSVCPSDLDLRDRFRGALIGGAIGDATGRPNEGRPTVVARERKIRAYQPWHGWAGGPKGTITDDTQMTMWLAESILASAEQAAGAERQRGSSKVRRYDSSVVQESGRSPEHEGRGSVEERGVIDLRDRVLDPAVARMATALSRSLAPLDTRLGFCADLALLLDGLEKPGYPLNGSTGAASLHGRIGTELPRFLSTGEAPFATWHNGAYVLGSFPCAVWCFLQSPEDFGGTLFTAVDAGYDADTVAAMACTLAGAYHGYSRLPRRLVDDLEYHDRLLELADGLYTLNRRLRMAAEPTREQYRPRVLPLTQEGMLIALDPRSGSGSGEARLVRRSASPCILALEVDARGVQGEGEDEYRALADLAGHLVGHGIHLRCCGSCLRFRFSPMSYQMSGGTKGYCALGKEDNSAERCTQADVVSIWDVCADFRYGFDRVWDD